MFINLHNDIINLRVKIYKVLHMKQIRNIWLQIFFWLILLAPVTVFAGHHPKPGGDEMPVVKEPSLDMSPADGVAGGQTIWIIVGVILLVLTIYHLARVKIRITNPHFVSLNNIK